MGRLAHLEQLKEFTLGRRQWSVRQHLQQVAKIVAAVERDPLHLRTDAQNSSMPLSMHMSSRFVRMAPDQHVSGPSASEQQHHTDSGLV